MFLIEFATFLFALFRIQARNDTRMDDEEKDVSDIAFTISPVYVTPKAPKLKKGEAIDHPVAPRYGRLMCARTYRYKLLISFNYNLYYNLLML